MNGLRAVLLGSCVAIAFLVPAQAARLVPIVPVPNFTSTVAYGINDDNVFVRHSLELSRELLLHGRPHNCLLLAGITHMQSDATLYKAMLRREIDFFREALG